MSEFEKHHKNKNGLNTWEIMRSDPDPELQRELDQTELSIIKNRNFKYDKYVGAFVNGLGEKAKSAADAIAKNYKVRKAASKIIKDNAELNNFMTAPDYDTYAKPFENILTKLKKPKKTPPPTMATNDFVNPEPTTEEKFEPIKQKTASDLAFEKLIEDDKKQKAAQEYEINHRGLAALKDRI